MRRLILTFLTVCLAASLASTASPYDASAEEEPETISQGSLATFPHADVSEGPSPGHAQIVDNATDGRFQAPGWERRTGTDHYANNYAYTKPSQAKDPARFKLNIPATGLYTLYAWWPTGEGAATAARFGVSTASGEVQWTEVNQQEEGGMWVRLGSYEMEAGDGYAVQVSGTSEGGGEVLADAVMILSGEQEDPEAVAGAQISVAGGRNSGRDVVRVARRHIGTPYVKSPPKRCRAYRKEDCSCHTKLVFKKFGRRLVDNPPDQWRRGRRINDKSDLRPGDMVFFDENRNGRLQPWDHVGIYSGNGYLIHASSYFGRVVESKMKHIHGYWGARRLER
jgi:cell wall-associated NlpC family hydrolase